MRTCPLLACVAVALILPLPSPLRADDPEPLPGTRPLDWDGDLASRMIDGIDSFLLKKTAASVEGRAKHWKRDTSSAGAYEASIRPNRERLAHILGVRDPLVEFDSPRAPLIVPPTAPLNLAGRAGRSIVKLVVWPTFGDVEGEGLILIPEPGEDANRPAVATVIVLPDADQSPEQLAGLVPGVPPASQVARRLAESGCRVIIPALVDRAVEARNGRARLTNREYLQRPAYELGRTLPGFEVEKVLALLPWLDREARELGVEPRIGVFGSGEGGLIALYAGALDARIDAVAVSGAFDSRVDTWREPVDRNVFGLLDQFGGAELASLVAPRPLIVEAAAWPDVTLPPGTGGAPGRLETPPLDAVKAEVERARGLVEGLDAKIELIVSGDAGDGPPGTEPALRAFLAALAPKAELAPPGEATHGHAEEDGPGARARSIRDRQARLVHAIDRHTQQLLTESPYVRAEFMKDLDTSTPEKYRETSERYRTIFRDEVVGRFEDELLPPDPRSRKVFDEEKYTGYEVVLDVFPEVFAYGILLVPKGIQEGERRPVVVCQHGLEGRPSDVADPKVNNPAYNQFAIRLAERGFITFAPQNPYIFQDRFRTLQRKANPLGKTLFSVIVPQHQQIVDWLKSLPNVDGGRIAFYGLSYGGKTAMRVPALVPDYCLSICSADFNEWVWKNASTRSPYSYVWSNEYEIFEWDLGSTFNYAEMAALIAPRPFMVERGHFDGVAPDEMVAHEFAKVRFLYEARLNLPGRCALEWFVGPHTIHGAGTFAFLHEHLDWPVPAEAP
jgi:dienelactone hydrolase